MKRPPAAVLLLLLPLLWLSPMLREPDAFPFLPGADYSDLVIAHWPNALLIHHSIVQYGEIPLWNQHILGGIPFAADPLSGLFYPPLWLPAALPAPVIFNLIFLCHMMLAGLGAYRLARAEGIPEGAALLAGLIFGGMPKLTAHLAAGHLTLVCAVAWTPWLILAAGSITRGGRLRQALLTGAAAGILFLADPRWAPPAAVAAMGYAFFAWVKEAKQPSRIPFRRFMGLCLIAAAVGVGVAAPLALPLLQYIPLSTRSLLSGSESAIYSLPVSSLPGLLFSGWSGSIEWVIYPGAVVVALLLGAVAFSRRRELSGASTHAGAGRIPFWTLFFLFVIWISLGENGFLFPALSSVLPGFELLRVPPRWMFLGGLCLAMLSAHGLHVLVSGLSGSTVHGGMRSYVFSVLVAGGALAVGAAILALPTPILQTGLVWAGIALILLTGSACKSNPRWIIAAVLLIAAADLSAADLRLVEPRTASAVLTPHEPAVQMLKERMDLHGEAAEDYRIYSPSDSIPQALAVRHGFRLLNGIHPMIPAGTAAAVADASGVAYSEYSVTLPPFTTGNPETDNRDAIPDARLLGCLNVKYVVSAFPVSAEGLRLAAQEGSIYLYENDFVRPRVWWTNPGSDQPLPAGEYGAQILSASPNRLTIKATGHGVLSLSEAPYPGWRTFVNGMEVAETGLHGEEWAREISLRDGEAALEGGAIVEMIFDPWPLWIGLAILFITAVIGVGVWRWSK